jgi:hypothetical protein
MMTSSTVFPVEAPSNKKSEPVEVSSNQKSEVKDQRAEVDFGTTEETASSNAVEGSSKFEDTDNNDNVPDESHSNRDAPEEEKFTENAMEKPVEMIEEASKEKEDSKDSFDDANGKSGGQSAKEGGETGHSGDEEEKTEERKDNDTTTENDAEKSDGEKKEDQEAKSEDDSMQDATEQSQIQEKVEESGEKEQAAKANEVFPDGAQAELLKESNTENGSFPTQAAESKNEKEAQASSKPSGDAITYSWKLCKSIAVTDFIPCLDNEKAIKKLHSTKHYEHRERHCPEEPPTCLVPLPEGYKRPIEWPMSRDKVLLSFHDVPIPLSNL